MPHIIFSSLHFILKYWHIGKALPLAFLIATAVTGGSGRGVCHWRIDRSQRFRSLLLPQKERSCHIHFNLQQVPNNVNVSVRSCFVSSFLSLVALTKDKEDKTPSHGLCSAGEFFKRLGCTRIASNRIFLSRKNQTLKAILHLTYRYPMSYVSLNCH